MLRRLARALAGVLLLLGLAAPAFAQIPDRAIRLIVPAAPGGTADILARLLAQKLGESWGQSVVVDNRPAGRGVVGTEAVARAPADGTTLALFSSSQALTPLAIPNLPYDTFRDLAAVSPVVTAPGLLVVNPRLVNVPDLPAAIALVRANPGRFNFASPVPLTAGHRSMELLKFRARLDMQHIAYNGGAPAVTDLLAGNVQFLVIAVPSVAQQVANGGLRALAVSSAQRFPGLPDMPTIAESGFPGFDSVEWYGVFTRAGVPAPVITRMATDIQAVLAQPETRDRLATLGAAPWLGNPDDLATRLREEHDRWQRLSAEMGLKFE